MIKFFKDSVRELKHVVWPTKKQTTDYFIIVVIILVLFWIYLFIFSNLFSESIYYLKGIMAS